MSKKLVAYFSASGVTKRLAKSIAEVTGSDLFEIEPKVPYTTADLDWRDKNSRSSIEMSNPSSRPEIAVEKDNMDEYDTVFVGFPVWWYVAPTIINNFMESYDFSGKTIITFCTSGGSGLGDSEKILKKCCSPSAKWIAGKRFNDGETKDSLKTWINGLGL